RLDRQTPWWQTWPINTSAVTPSRIDAVPPLRTSAHLLATLFPELGFGEPRFPDRGAGTGVVRPQPSIAPIEFRGIPEAARAVAHESFTNARHPEGRDLRREGPYRPVNSGPRFGAG